MADPKTEELPEWATPVEDLPEWATPVADVPGPNADGVREPDAAPAEDGPAWFSPTSISGTIANHSGQGGTLGLADELTGAVGAADELGKRFRKAVGIPWDNDTLGSRRGDDGRDVEIPLREALVRRYVADRNSARLDAKRGAESNPGTALAAGVAGGLALPIPGGGAAKGAGMLAKAGVGALKGAAIGGVAGAGMSEADSLGGMLADAGRGAGIGGALGAGGAYLGAKASNLVSSAALKARDLQEKLAEKVFASARGAAGGETSAAFRTLEQTERALNDPSVSAQARAAAQAFLSSQEAADLRNKVLLGAADRGKDQLARVDAAMQEMAAKNAARAPAAVDAATADYLSQSTLKNDVLPRAVRIGQRWIPPAVADLLGGGAPGVAAGALVGSGMGAPGTTMANMLKSPRFQMRMGQFLTPLARAAERGPAALASAHFLLSQKDPTYQQTYADAQKEAGDDH